MSPSRIEARNIKLHPGNKEAKECIGETSISTTGPPNKHILTHGQNGKECADHEKPHVEPKAIKEKKGQRVRFSLRPDVLDCGNHISGFGEK